MDQQIKFTNLENKNKPRKHLWLKVLIVSSAIIIPIIIIAGNNTCDPIMSTKNCNFANFWFAVSSFLYVAFIIVSIFLGLSELSKKVVNNTSPEIVVSEKKDDDKINEEKRKTLRRISVLIAIFIYRFIIHIETLIDYSRFGFTYESSLFVLPLEIVIIIALSVFVYKIIKSWHILLGSVNRIVIYVILSLSVLGIVWSITDIILAWIHYISVGVPLF